MRSNFNNHIRVKKFCFLVGNRQNDNIDVHFLLALDNYLISQIEKLRRYSDLNLRLHIRFLVYPINEPANTRQRERILEGVIIPKSDWVENKLQELKYKNVALIEVPILQNKDLSDIIDQINLARKIFLMGDHKQVLGKCRIALEGLASKVKESGRHY